MQNAVNDLRTKVSWLQTNAGAGAPAFAASQVDNVKCLVDPKSLKINDFYGDEAKFMDFVDESKQYANLMNAEIGEALEWIEWQDIEVTDATLQQKYGSKLDAINREIHGFLTAKMKGVSKNWLKSQVQGEGLKVWRAMLQKYDPTTGSTMLDMQRQLMKEPARCRDVSQVPLSLIHI